MPQIVERVRLQLQGMAQGRSRTRPAAIVFTPQEWKQFRAARPDMSEFAGLALYVVDNRYGDLMVLSAVGLRALRAVGGPGLRRVESERGAAGGA